MLQHILTTVTTIFLVSCEHTKDTIFTERALKKIMESFHGSTQKELVEKLGYPDTERKSPDGNLVYEYTSSRSIQSASQATSTSVGSYTFSSITGGNVSNYQCKRWFEIKDNKVIAATFRGNDCVAPEKIVGCYNGNKFYGLGENICETPRRGDPIYELDERVPEDFQTSGKTRPSAQ